MKDLKLAKSIWDEILDCYNKGMLADVSITKFAFQEKTTVTIIRHFNRVSRYIVDKEDADYINSQIEIIR